jgi:hypothetical protein
MFLVLRTAVYQVQDLGKDREWVRQSARVAAIL